MLTSAAGKPYWPNSFQSRRLWSLWDMLEFKASAFYQVTSNLADMAAWLRAKGDDDQSVFYGEKTLDNEDSRFAKGRLRGLPEQLEIIGARVTALAVQDTEDNLDWAQPTWGRVRDLLVEIQNTLRRELTLLKFFALEADRHSYYAPDKPLFGQDFETNFPSAAFDLDEAAKCYALGRSTACVFHLMRVMEIGVRAVARSLRIPDPTKPAERNWGFVLKEVRDSIDARWPTTAALSTGDGQIFDALYASLDAVKNPWRNDTMHPGGKYTDDEAEHIFTAVKGFMKRLAFRMDENGSPQA